MFVLPDELDVDLEPKVSSTLGWNLALRQPVFLGVHMSTCLFFDFFCAFSAALTTVTYHSHDRSCHCHDVGDAAGGGRASRL